MDHIYLMIIIVMTQLFLTIFPNGVIRWTRTARDGESLMDLGITAVL